jgi:hypothetical protein
MEINITYFSKGGQFPYQAEGEINGYFFYYRARHNEVSLTLYPKVRENMVYRDTYNLDQIGHANLEKNSYVTDEEADNDIRVLYNKIKTNGNKNSNSKEV